MADPSKESVTQTDDPLAKALQSLFVSFASVVQGELQSSNNEYDLLKNMNLRATTEYDNFGDFASGLSSFVESVKAKNEHFNQYLQDMEVIDKQVTELEALVTTLDNYTSTLQAQIKVAYAAAKRPSGHF
ncbi:hypothetical protein R1flu_011464 [Riccia fluitans]|uniref:Biogenesis of lysosome-related organelles complex 1 subunit 2 n=1 Tax=Riccia fluitans TaxID=41844 RepID=A0ABD1ZC44_9MARC